MPYGTLIAEAMQSSSGDLSGGLYGFKNRLINSAMVIDQRAAGATTTVTTNAYVSCDRWQTWANVSSKFSIGQSSQAPNGFSKSLCATSLSAYSPAAGEYFYISQFVEGYNFADMQWGTLNAKTVTLSFWVRSSLTGTFGGGFENEAGTRSYPFTYTINSADTWEYKTVTVAGDTTGTWTGATNAIGVQLWFGVGTGSTRQGTPNTWQTGNFPMPTGMTQVVGTNGATFYITGVQLEKGSTATSFDYRPYGTELQLCQRYYAKTFPQTVAPANGLGTNYFLGYSSNSSNPVTNWKFPVTMRSTPTVTLFNDRSGGTAGQWTNNSTDSANARPLGGSTEFVMLDNSAVALSSSNWWLGGATASAEL